MQMNNEFLPLGTVVQIKDHDLPVVIFARIVLKNEGDTKYYDYMAVNYAEGYSGGDSISFFDMEDIEDILFVGMQNKEVLEMQNQLNEIKNQGIDIEKMLNHKNIMDFKL